MQLTRRIFLKLLASSVIAQKLLPTSLSKSNASALPNSFAKQMIHPGKPRVIRSYSPEATFWNYQTKPYVNFIRQDIVNQMLEFGLCTFAGTSSAAEAWQRIMPTYQNGDKIAVKPNLNALHLGYEQNITTTPAIINAVISSLINALGVSPGNIYVYDLCVNVQLIKQILRYPVNCVGRSTGSFSDKLKLRLHIGLNTSDSSATIEMRHPVYDAAGKQVRCYVPNVLTQTDHLINVPVLKAHQFVLISSAFKNHFGTVRYSNYSQYPVILHGKPLQPALVDIYHNKHIKDKTRLIIADALFGAPLYGHNSHGRLPTPWHTLPGDKTPNSIFLATDPVAVESVIGDYVAKEQTRQMNLRPHDYLHLAAKENLGIHEHRSADGTYDRIEYGEVTL